MAFVSFVTSHVRERHRRHRPPNRCGILNGVWWNCFRFTYSFGLMAKKNGEKKNEWKISSLIKFVYTGGVSRFFVEPIGATQRTVRRTTGNFLWIVGASFWFSTFSALNTTVGTASNGIHGTRARMAFVPLLHAYQMRQIVTWRVYLSRVAFCKLLACFFN